jgi:hypothetical protein
VRVTAALEGRPGILQPPSVDMRRSRVRVAFDPQRVTPARIASWIETREDYSCPEPGVVREVVRD